MANPNPTYKYKPLYGEPLADQMTSVRLPLDLHSYVRSLPNRAEWLRRAIADAYERDMAATSSSDSATSSNISNQH